MFTGFYLPEKSRKKSLLRDFSSSFFGAEFLPHSQCKNDQYFPRKLVENSQTEISSRNQAVQILALDLCHFVNPVILR